MKNVRYLIILVFLQTCFASEKTAKLTLSKKIQRMHELKKSKPTGGGEIVRKKVNLACDREGYPTIVALKKLMFEEYFSKNHITEDMLKIKIGQGGLYSKKIYSVGIEQNGKYNPVFFLKISSLQFSDKMLMRLQKSYIGRFRLEAAYNSENKLMSKKQLPIITWIENIFDYTTPDGQQRAIEVSHAARGEEINYIFRQGNKEKIAKSCYAVGQALGLFAQLFEMKLDTDSSHWLTVCHADSHGGNVFFDSKTSQVYFIDTPTMHDKCNYFADLNKFMAAIRFHFQENRERLDIALREYIKGYLQSFPIQRRADVVSFLLKDTAYNSGIVGEILKKSQFEIDLKSKNLIQALELATGLR